MVADWSAERALSVLRRLLERERGAYWTFCFFTGDRFLIGASPERHVSVRDQDVRMNPISGTFRVGGDLDTLKPRLLDFLADEKEVFELFMVVDEELKMMCEVCHEGGQVLGPFLKPMTHLVHTEYLLAGRSERDPREILRDTMYAATVTGAPVENACRLIADYESEGRGYYAAALALFGRDAEGHHTMDSPILIRTADVDLDGRLKVTAGATLVRDSDAAYEVAETHAKAGGILGAFGLVPRATAPAEEIAALTRDEDVLLALGTRNQRLSRFWLTDQEGAPPDPSLAGRSAVILHGEDDFVNMLRHVLGVFGMTSTVVRHEDYATGAFDGADLVVDRSRARRPARRRPPQDRGVPPGRRRRARRRPAVPRRVPGPPDAVRAPRHPARLQGHRLPGHPVADPAGGTHRAGRLLQHLRRPGRRPATSCRRASRSSATRRPATCTRSPGRTSAASSSTPSRSSPRTATT